jgi:hypothetical protein
MESLHKKERKDVHFLGLTLSLGAIFTNIMVERHTRGGSLEMLSIGRS